MTEYWKSTPTYWCKFCETYVRDTPISKQQHEATGKHQGAIQRSLRKLHRDQENEQREKQRAQGEVARLKGIVSGKPAPKSSSHAASRSSQASTAQPKATNEDRMRQLKQLADLGVAVPDEYRKDMAMAGEWQTVSIKPVKPETEGKEESAESRSFGVRKRKAEDVEDAEDELEEPVAAMTSNSRGTWGSRMKTYQHVNDTEIDFDQLLKSSTVTSSVKKEEETDDEKKPDIKHSVSDTANAADSVVSKPDNGPALDQDHIEAKDTVPVVFKKRKAKASRPP